MKNKRGFTLIELLAVIVIIGLVAILAIPALVDNMNEKKKSTFEVYSNKVLSSAKEKYSLEFVNNKNTAPVRRYTIDELKLEDGANYQGTVVASYCYGKYNYILYLWNEDYEIFGQRLDGSKVRAVPYKESDLDAAKEEWNTYTDCIDFKDFEVTLNHNYGENEKIETIMVRNKRPYGKLPVLERPGYKFEGWFTDRTSGIKITNETKYFVGNPDTPLTLYAHWEACPAGSYCAKGNDPQKCEKNTYSSAAASTTCTSCAKGYESGVGATTCTPITYHITYSYDCNGATAPNTVTEYTIETKNIPLQNPSTTGYTFSGWLEKNRRQYFNNSVIPTGTTDDLDLVAQCNINQYHFVITKNPGIDKIYYKTGNQTTYTESSATVNTYVDYNTPFSYYATPVSGYTVVSKPGNSSSNPYTGKINVGENSFGPSAKPNEVAATAGSVNASIRCTDGRKLSGTNCTYYYEKNANKCGTKSYNCDCKTEECDCKDVCVSGEETYTYTGRCSSSGSCTGGNSTCESSACRGHSNCDADLSNYDQFGNAASWTATYDCTKTGTRTNSCLSTKKECKSCESCSTCTSAESCTLTENKYREYYCAANTATNVNILSGEKCNTYTCPSGYSNISGSDSTYTCKLIV